MIVAIGRRKRDEPAKRVLVRIEGDVLRVRSLHMKKSASEAERDRVVKALQQAIQFLESDK